MNNTAKTILITGANDGLGFEAAKQLAQLNHHIILLCRSQSKAEAAKRRIVKDTGNENIDFVIANLIYHQQIKTAAQKLKLKYKQIDVLINNAGGVFSYFEKSHDGLEMTIALNHFSYFLLTYYLQELLFASDSARVINVSSISHVNGKINFESFISKKNYSILGAYEQSKLANVLFTYHLAALWKNRNITVNALNPGTVKTKIGEKSKSSLHRFLWRLLSSTTGVNINKGAATHVMLAVSETLNGETGKYFSKQRQTPSSKLSYNEILAADLWKTTETLSGVSFH